MRAIRNKDFQCVLIPKCATRSLLDFFVRFPQQDFGAKHVKYKRLNRFEFTFIREPFDRLLSAYFDKVLRKRNEHGIKKYGLKHGDSFERFLQVVLKTNNEHWRPQIDYVGGCHFIGRVETINRDFHKVCRILGIDYKPLPVKNPSYKKDIWDQIPKELSEKVKQKYKQDIVLYERVTATSGKR